MTAIAQRQRAARALELQPGQSDRADGRARTRLWLIACVLTGATLRLWDLGSSRLNYDESFTAMAGRLPVGKLFDFLGARDSHPPLDYLVRLPLARAGVSELWFRLPSVAFSLGALVLFACWMRSRGRVGVIATALMAIDAFQVAHGREARMYAEMELVGVAVAVVAAGWLERPRRWHAPLVGFLVLAGLLTHVSMFLLAGGLFVLPGRRRDRDAWTWRAAIGLGVLGWLILWGPIFVTQAGGGHSSWIAPTTPIGLATALARLVTFDPALAVPAAALIAAGGLVIWRSDRVLGRVWVCCWVVPVGIAAVVGRVEPVVLDRTFTVVAWAPLLAVAYVLERLIRRTRIVGALAAVALLALLVPSVVTVITQPTGPDAPLRRLEQVVRPGDVVAVRPVSKAPELQWSLGVRSRFETHRVRVPDVPGASGLAVGAGRPSGRLWLLDWRTFRAPLPVRTEPCARHWSWGHTRIRCLRLRPTARPA